MAGYILQGKTEDGSVKDIPLAATYDETGNKITEHYAAKTEYQQIDNDLAELSGKVDSISEEVTNANTAIGNVKSAVDGADTKIQTLTTKVDEISGEISGVGEKITSIEGEVSGVGEKITGIEEDVGQLATDVASLTTDVGQLNTDVGGVKTDVAGVLAKANSNGEKLDAIDKKATTIQTDTATVKTDVAEVKGNVGTANTKLDAVQSTLDEIKEGMSGGGGGDVGVYGGVVSVTGKEISLNTGTAVDAATIIRLGNGGIKATSFDESVATAEIVGNILKLTPQNISEEKDVEVAISVASDGSYAPTSTIYKARVPKRISNVLDENGWGEIFAAGKAGVANTLWHVGDEKNIELITGEKITLVILGFGHDDLADDTGKAPITFGMKHLLTTTYKMNSSNTNAGGWESSAMRTSTMQTLFNNLPEDLKQYIRPVKKLASAGEQSSTIKTTTDKLWLLSEIEVFGKTTYSKSGEGTQYAYWAQHDSNADRVKKLTNGTGSASFWWLRSPTGSNSTSFCYVGSGGSASYYSASGSDGVSFGFCI